MSEVQLICKCFHKESDHYITACSKCDCAEYKSIGSLEEEYKSLSDNVGFKKEDL